MRRVWSLVCSVYWASLTALLLLPHSAQAIGLGELPRLVGQEGGLLAAFGLLTILAHASRWPKGIGWPMLVLVAYALSVQGLQAYVTSQTLPIEGLLASLGGIAAGVIVYGAVHRVIKPRRTRRDRHEILRSFLDLQRMHL